MNLTLWDPENLKYETFIRATISYLGTDNEYFILDLNDEDDSENSESPKANES